MKGSLKSNKFCALIKMRLLDGHMNFIVQEKVPHLPSVRRGPLHIVVTICFGVGGILDEFEETVAGKLLLKQSDQIFNSRDIGDKTVRSVFK